MWNNNLTDNTRTSKDPSVMQPLHHIVWSLYTSVEKNTILLDMFLRYNYRMYIPIPVSNESWNV